MTPVRLRAVALPVEHGGWALVGAPILLGVLVAPSTAGACLGVAVLAAFLARQPLGVVAGDLRRNRRYPRTAWAEVFLAAWGAIALVALGTAWWVSPHSFVLPLAIAAPLGAVQVRHGLRGRGRSTTAQLCGAMAAGCVTAAIAMADGWPAWPALLLAFWLALQSTSAIVYVATRLRLARGAAASRTPAHAMHLGALVVAIALAGSGHAATTTVALFGVLALRASVGLRERARRTPTVIVGVQEVGFSLLTVLWLWLGARAGS